MYNNTVLIDHLLMSPSEITYSHARAHLSEVLDRVGHDREIITVTRRNQPDVAIIAADELSSLLESVYLLRSPANAKRLFRSMEWAKSAEAIPQTLDELKQELSIEPQ
jgi:antitoxin YefM